MCESLETLIREWNGLAVLVRYWKAGDSWIFVALHDDTLGSPVGGTRMRVYSSPSDGLRDAMRLAEGMTHKWAALGMDAGGGKAVLAVPEIPTGESRNELLRCYGALLEAMQGGFATGRDLGTTDEDMRVLRGATRWVHGVEKDGRRVRDPGPYTAQGVLAALRAVCTTLFGNPEPEGRSILIQGVGDVGEPLARGLVAGGATVLISDTDLGRAELLARELGVATIDPESVYETPCDVFAPCAVGGLLNAETIPLLRCRAVAGAANNQLAEDEDAQRLHARGILYAPDFVANGGAALAFGLIHRGVDDENRLRERLSGIEQSLERILVEARKRDESPQRTARRRVAATLRSSASTP